MIKILYLEDEEEDFGIVREYLAASEKNFYFVERANSVLAAEVCMRVENYDLFLVDYLLGNRRNGETALEFVKKLLDTDWPRPVILISGLARSELDAETLGLISSGRIVYLAKDELTSGRLLEALRRAVDNRLSALVVEPDEDDYALMKRALRELVMFQVRVDRACDENEARVKAANREYDLFVVDCGISEDRGTALVRELVTDDGVRTGVLVTGDAEREYDHETLDLITAGKLGFVNKQQMTPASLAQTILHTRFCLLSRALAGTDSQAVDDAADGGGGPDAVASRRA